MSTAPSPLTYEQAYAQAEAIIAALEQGKIGLEESAEAYEKASALLRYCQSILANLETKIQRIQVAEDGKVELPAMQFPGQDAPAGPDA